MRASLERTLADAAVAVAGFALQPPPVPDHTLLHPIGSGAYGEVWLARNALGTLRAVKIVHRARFKEDRPYEREFNGILKYEPVSRTHEGLVQVLHAGRDEARGCFYYVMELADDAGVGEGARECGSEEKPCSTHSLTPPLPRFPASYSPRTLRSELALQQRLAPAEAAQLVLRLAGALAHLHAHGLVHRDIKPSNVIFVRGQPKLADIGLVTDVGDSRSYVGTEGFIPPEGPGTPRADLYGLGKLLYELATGRDRMDFPQLPPGVMRLPDGEALLELNEVMVRACAPEPKDRYASATEFQAELNLFLAGRSLRRARNAERHLARLKRFAFIACAFLMLAAVALWFSRREERHARERAQAANERASTEAELRQRAEAAEHETQQQLHTALLEQARATVRSGEMGHRLRALDALRRAAAISNTAELRREVFAALALPDLRYERELPYGAVFTMRSLDPAFGRIALCRGKGPVEIRSTADLRLLATLPASTNLPAYNNAIWSADGTCLVLKRDRAEGGERADWEVWDVARARRILLLRDAPWTSASFHPHSRRLMVGEGRRGVAVWDLESGDEVARYQLAGTPNRILYSPDGGRFAALLLSAGSWTASVHDATNGALLATHAFSDSVHGIAWHPGGEWIAVVDSSAAVRAMDARNGETRMLGRHKADAASAVFSPDGTYLLSGGWENELICWDARTLRQIFTIGLQGYEAQFRADGRAVSVLTVSGVQLHEFERPSGYREFAEDLGERLRHAAFSSDGRWLAASADKRMGLWDLTGSAPGAISEKAYEAKLFFTQDGHELFGSRSRQGDSQCFRWRVSPAANAVAPPVLEKLPLQRPRGFTYLPLHSNSIVMTSTNGSQILLPDQIATGSDRWLPTAPGLNGVSLDGRWLGIFLPYATSLYVYRLPGMERVAKLPHPGSIGGFEFSPRGDEVALASRAGVEFWSTATWERTRVLPNFSRILYAPDARTLWLRKDLRTSGLHEAKTLEPLLPLPNGMVPLALSPDGRHIAVSLEGRRLQVWDLAALRQRFREMGMDWSEEPTVPVQAGHR